MEKKKHTSLPAWRQEAQRLLHARGRLLRLALYGILSVFLLMLPFALSMHTVSLLSLTPIWSDTVFMETILPYLLMIPTFLLVTCPLTVTVLRYVVAVVKDERPMRRKKGGYGRDVLFGLLTLVWLLLPVVLMLVAWTLPSQWVAAELESFWGNLLGIMLGALAAITVGSLSLPWFFLTRRLFFVPYYAATGCTLREAFGRSRARFLADKPFPTAFATSFLGLLVLSVLSLGVILIFYTLPLVWTAYCLVASAPPSTNENSPRGSNE